MKRIGAACLGACVVIGSGWVLRDAPPPAWSGWAPQRWLTDSTDSIEEVRLEPIDGALAADHALARRDARPAEAVPVAGGAPFDALEAPTIDALLAEVRGDDIGGRSGEAAEADAEEPAVNLDDWVRHDMLVIELDATADPASIERALPAGAVARRQPLALPRGTAPRLANRDPQGLAGWLACREELERTWVYELTAPVEDPPQVLSRLRELPGVLSAEFDVEGEAAAFDPQDPVYVKGKLYGHAKLRIEEAWQAYRGDDVVVAVIDTGLRYKHREFRSSALWRNPGEIPRNGKDDDKNGCVDDVRGWDFVDEDSSPNDHLGHGTHVSGTIGARADGVGMVGLAPGVKLMTLRIFDENGRTTSSCGLRALIYAVENGARVTNQSWGGPARTWGEGMRKRYKRVYAAAWRAGVLNVVSAGNDGSTRRSQMPAALETVISVAAVKANGERAKFSNYDAHIAAPGVEIYSADADGNASYRRASGTSMAAPHVTATLALLVEQSPDISAADAVRQLFRTTWVVGSVRNYGAGIVDAAAATGQAPRMSGSKSKLRSRFKAR